MQKILKSLTTESIAGGFITGGVIGSLVGLKDSTLIFYGLVAIALAILNLKNKD